MLPGMRNSRPPLLLACWMETWERRGGLAFFPFILEQTQTPSRCDFTKYELVQLMSGLDCTSNDILRAFPLSATGARPKAKATLCIKDIRDYLRRQFGGVLAIWSMVLDHVSIAHTATLNSLLVRAVATERAESRCGKNLKKGEGFP